MCILQLTFWNRIGKFERFEMEDVFEIAGCNSLKVNARMQKKDVEGFTCSR